MKHFPRLPRFLSQALTRLQRRFQQARPGSILIMVVALLVLLALMGTAYIATARLDRAGSVQLQMLSSLNDVADSLLKSQSDSIKFIIAHDNFSLTGITTPDPTVNANNTNANGTPWLASNVLSLLPGAPNAATALPPIPPSGGGGVAWRAVSRLANTSFESPLGTSNAPDSTITNYDTTQDLQSWFRATNVAVYYDGSLTQTDPTLIGHTYVFPAFRKTHFTGGKWVDDAATVIAADATGAGIANCGLFRLTQTPFQGVTFYGGLYVVDNAASLNVNIAWDSQADRDANGNCYDFFLNDVDLAGFLNKANNATNQELKLLNSLRYSGIDSAPPPRADDTGPRADVAYFNNADAFYQQLGRRINNPNVRANAGDPTNNHLRPFAEADTAGLRYRGGMVNQASGRSNFDSNMFQQANDSIYHAALNYTATATNQFKFVAANNAEYWYDWYFGNDGFLSAPQLQIGNKLGTAVNGAPFRTPRGLLVANNPVKNLARELTANPPIPVQAFSGIDQMFTPADTILPHKTSLNTAPFGDLYRTFATAFTDSVLNANGFQIATDDPTNLGVNIGIFRNPLRDPTIGTSAVGTNTNRARNRFDSFNVALLRAAIAAANVETLRDNHGSNPIGNYFYPDATRRIISLKTVGGINVQAAVYGVTPQVYITEVYANTDQTDHGGKKNANGIVAIRLFNPYPYPLDLSEYELVLVDRKRTGTYPAMRVTRLDPNHLSKLPVVAANSAIVLSNYKSGGAGTAAPYLPSKIPAATAAAWTYWPNLYMVIEDAGTPNSGGELMILKSMTPGIANSVAEVPADSFDFTGLLLNTANKKADEWHYDRAQSTTGLTAWKFVYPGRYIANSAQGGIGNEVPRQELVSHSTWDTTSNPEPWLSAGQPAEKISLEVGSNPAIVPTVLYTNNYPGIQLCNVDFGGFNKPIGNAARKFPFGGFARTGDVIQATFIGPYVIAPTPVMSVNTHQVPTTVMEMNAVTMDSAYVDDADASDDAYEMLGRFVPVQTPDLVTVDDYNPYGYYGSVVPSVDPSAPPGGMTIPNRPKWRYHFALSILNSFTAISNPHDDMFPNYAATSYLPTIGGKFPTAVPNTIATNSNPNGPEEGHLPVEGLINLNTASWQVLSAIEWSPPASTMTKSNQEVAKLIVRYRDVDDGIGRSSGPRGHGPFNSIMELNDVFDPFKPVNTYGNAFGALPAITDIKWGNYAPGPATVNTYTENRAPNDFMTKTLMVSRVSNLLTTRSDSFTAYIIVQGWKNVGTAFPELVVQKRAAFLVDRSGVTATNKAVTSYSIPAK